MVSCYSITTIESNGETLGATVHGQCTRQLTYSDRLFWWTDSYLPCKTVCRHHILRQSNARWLVYAKKSSQEWRNDDARWAFIDGGGHLHQMIVMCAVVNGTLSTTGQSMASHYSQHVLSLVSTRHVLDDTDQLIIIISDCTSVNADSRNTDNQCLHNCRPPTFSPRSVSSSFKMMLFMLLLLTFCRPPNTHFPPLFKLKCCFPIIFRILNNSNIPQCQWLLIVLISTAQVFLFEKCSTVFTTDRLTFACSA